MRPDYPAKIFSDKRVCYYLLVQSLSAHAKGFTAAY